MSTKITYETPIIGDDITTPKPMALANQPYPYHNVSSDRRFEELIYTIYKKKSENDTVYAAKHDAIKLMQGVGESGRDCVLYKNSIANGAIQCKKYNTRISKPDCAKEIIKFVLFSMLDNTLLPNVNDFTYYFVAAADFTGPASTLVDDFGKNILAETDLQKWTEEVIKEYKTFAGLVYTNIEAALKKTLGSLKVERIGPRDLDIEMNNAYSKDIITLFFEVKTVIDSRTVDQLLETLAQNKVSLSDEEIVQKFETASLQLSTYKAELSNLPGSHIERTEAKEILSWIAAPVPAKQDPVLLLEGDPGYGKSVILKDVYDQLVKDGIPVVGIKSDRYYVSSISELSEKMNFDHSIIDLAKKLVETYATVVILIDQIDSLSQAVTTKRDYIDTYNKILHELQRIPRVKIVISIRTFDLTYDYEFTNYRQFKKVTVQPLSKSQLTTALTKLGINIDSLSENLVSLISVPNHLDIFCKIFSPGFNTDQIATLQDLYYELWKQKISGSAAGSADENRDALFEISEKLYTNQTLIISSEQLSEKTKNRVAFLTSSGLIDAQGNDLQFFHQSFRDYVFARHFTEKKQSVMDYIKAENQSLYIRPALKMILAAQRAQDAAHYIQTITELLFSGSVRLHIQLLVLNNLSFEANPVAAEKELVTKRILTSEKYKFPFLESAPAGGWFDTLQTSGVLDTLIITAPTKLESFCEKEKVKKFAARFGLGDFVAKHTYQPRMESQGNIWYQLMRHALVKEPAAALQYLDQTADFPNKSGIIVRLLYFVTKWDEPLACKLFDQYYSHNINSWLEFDHIIENAAPYNYQWCLDWFEKTCFDTASEGQYHDPTMIAFHKNAVAKKLFAVNRDQTFLFALRSIRSIIETKADEYSLDKTDLYDDIVFMMHDEDRSEHGSFHERLYNDCMDTAKQLAEEKSIHFDHFIKDVAAENSIGIIKIMLFSLQGNPSVYHHEIFTLLQRLYNAGAFRQRPKYHIRSLLLHSFASLDPAEKRALVDMIMAIKSENEMFKREINGKLKFVSWYGHLQFEYLSSIPETELKVFPEAYQRFSELKRKFKEAENKRDFSFGAHVIGAPLTTNAYESMQLDQWENSFLKYDKERDFHEDGFKGGLTEHYRAFEEQVTKRPDFFTSFIDKIITEKKVKIEYMIAGIDGLIKAKYDPKTVADLYKKLIKLPLERFDVLRTMWMIHYLSIHRMVDQEIFDHACNTALNDPNPDKVLNPDNPQFDALNTNRGAAADAVARCWYNPDFADKIFEVLEKMATDPIISVRLSAMRHIAYLMNVDKERTLKLFLTYINGTTDLNLYRASIDAAQYLARYNFKAMIPYFKAAVEIEDNDEESLTGNIAILLAMAWLNNEKEAFAILEGLWKKSDKARAKMIDVAIHNYRSDEPETKRRSEWLYDKFLNDEAKDVVHEYTSALLHLSPADFMLYHPLIKKFSKSKVAKKDPHYFYDYLIKCCKPHPVECLDLLTHSSKYNEPNHFTGPYYEGSEPVKILIGCYNGLYETLPLNRKYVLKAMDQFDGMLKRPLFRSAAHKVLNSI